MFDVLVSIGGVDEDVIKVDNNTDVEEVSEHIIEEVLKACWGVGVAESHNEWFELTITSGEGGLPLVSFANSDVVVSPSQVDLREDGCPSGWSMSSLIRGSG